MMDIKIPKQSILVPVDFSHYSEEALVYGSELASLLGVPLVVLHVVHDPGDAPGFYAKRRKSKNLKKMEDIAAEQMKEFLERAAGTYPSLKRILKRSETMLVSGLPVTRILEIVNKIQPRVVVMGSQGRTGLAHLMLGSKTEQIVRLCPVPITVVKSKAAKKKGELP